ncbi:MAG: TMEM165/GDT1 family protein [candidate division WOR-3 bacterium]
MDWRIFITVFGTIFLAELGDKTQLAIFSFACTSKYPLTVFLGASFALLLTSMLAVLVGTGLQRVIPVKILHIIAAIAFIIIGIILLIKTLRTN